jgi:hypothetical protein
MAGSVMVQPGIFCIETADWWGNYETSSVKAILELLGHGVDPKPNFVHRSAATREELRHHLGRWRRTRRFPILWLAFHGAPGRIHLADVGRRRTPTVTLDDMSEMMGRRCRGRLVHFGACSTLNIDKRHISRFLRTTGVMAATGFRKDLDWLTSSAGELLIMATLLRYRLTLDGVRRMDRALRREAPHLQRQLAFRMVVRER